MRGLRTAGDRDERQPPRRTAVDPAWQFLAAWSDAKGGACLSCGLSCGLQELVGSRIGADATSISARSLHITTSLRSFRDGVVSIVLAYARARRRYRDVPPPHTHTHRHLTAPSFPPSLSLPPPFRRKPPTADDDHLGGGGQGHGAAHMCPNRGAIRFPAPAEEGLTFSLLLLLAGPVFFPSHFWLIGDRFLC